MRQRNTEYRAMFLLLNSVDKPTETPVSIIYYDYISSCLSYYTAGEQQLLLGSEYWWHCCYWDLCQAKYLDWVKEIRCLLDLKVHNEFLSGLNSVRCSGRLRSKESSYFYQSTAFWYEHMSSFLHSDVLNFCTKSHSL